MFGQLPFDFNLNDWGDVVFLRGDYKLAGLPLTPAAEIAAETAWRLRKYATNRTNYWGSIIWGYAAWI